MHATRDRLVALFLGFTAIIALGCGADAPVAPALGSVEVRVTTESTVPLDNSNGYLLSIDGGRGRAVGVNDTITFGALPKGPHVVELTQLMTGCSVVDYDFRTANVAADAASVISFVVRCTDSDWEDPWGY